MTANLDQPRPQGLLLNDFQNGGSSGEDPGKGWITWYKISKNLGDFYHMTFEKGQNKIAAKHGVGSKIYRSKNALTLYTRQWGIVVR